MTNLKDIKTRIQSVKSTQKITRAMKMVAAAKVKHSENAVKEARPFTTELNTIFSKIYSSVKEVSDFELNIQNAIDNYPCLLKKRDVNEVGLLVITSNKGLAGAYNANIIKKTTQIIENYTKQNIKTKLFVVGNKGISALSKKCKKYNCELVKEYYEAINEPNSTNSNIIAEDIAQYFVNEKIDKIEIVTTRFKNMMSYHTENWSVLPLEIPQEDNSINPLMEFVPNKQVILQKIVPMYITNIIYQALLEAQASELAARMTAMSAATTNADKILTELSIQYNKTRQNAITQELIEVVSASIK